MAGEVHTFRNSTRVARGWYDPDTESLELEFRRDGARIVYRHVPGPVWESLLKAESAGRFVSQVLIQFPYSQRR